MPGRASGLGPGPGRGFGPGQAQRPARASSGPGQGPSEAMRVPPRLVRMCRPGWPQQEVAISTRNSRERDAQKRARAAPAGKRLFPYSTRLSERHESGPGPPQPGNGHFHTKLLLARRTNGPGPPQPGNGHFHTKLLLARGTNGPGPPQPGNGHFHTKLLLARGTKPGQGRPSREMAISIRSSY